MELEQQLKGGTKSITYRINSDEKGLYLCSVVLFDQLGEASPSLWLVLQVKDAEPEKKNTTINDKLK